MSNVWDTIFWDPPKRLGHFFIHCGTHSLSSKCGQAPLHSRCPWWPGRGPGIPKVLRPAATGLHIHQETLLGSRHGAKPQLLSVISFNPEPSTATEAASSPVASPGLSPCLALLHAPECFQNQYHLGNSYTAKFRCQYNPGHTWEMASVC